VVQAFTYEDAVECYKTYKELGYKKIAFSYGATYYGQFYANFQRDKAKAMGRIYVIKDIKEGYVMTYPKEFLDMFFRINLFFKSHYQN
jgi:hypothetical protein